MSPDPFHEIRQAELAKAVRRNRRLTWILVVVTCLNLLSFAVSMNVDVKQGSKTCTYEVVSGAQK